MNEDGYPKGAQIALFMASTDRKATWRRQLHWVIVISSLEMLGFGRCGNRDIRV